ncbi:MAG TPA: carboxypeptidase regulatory-like domain-containing protein, partial [Pyrinomonadaceae bacterium]|nr:carboxypeptidase regulatory-like domain-containing protein [Pyrinomonadaceae bacterium]
MKISLLQRSAVKGIRYAISALFVVLVFSVAVMAQESGSINGTVTDPNGALVPGATVTVKSVGTSAERTVTTATDGTYLVTNLQPGLYDVSVTATGFGATTQRAQVSVGGRLTLDFALGLGAQPTATVEVVAGSGGVEVNTTDQQVSSVVTNRQIRELPTVTRNAYDLVSLSGNVATDTSLRGTGFAINGQRAASTSILLDGAENVDTFTAGIGQAVPLDSVQEFRVITGNFSAEYGRASGGVVNVATIAGSNEFHGTLYEFNRISKLASNGFDNNANGIERAVFTRNQFGYSVGGPIFKNKLF